MKVLLFAPVFMALALTVIEALPQDLKAGCPTKTIDASDEARCSKIIGRFINGTFEGLEVTYDLKTLLEKYGGPPGKVNATWTEKEDAPVEESDSVKRPLPEANRKYWLYKFGGTDLKTHVRLEYAVRRFSGTPKGFTEFRGELFFTPDDFCGKLRKANYTVDDRGFTFYVTPGYCWVDEVSVGCTSPESCTKNADETMTCVPGKTHYYDSYASSFFTGSPPPPPPTQSSQVSTC